jgi:hypothetical protein
MLACAYAYASQTRALLSVSRFLCPGFCVKFNSACPPTLLPNLGRTTELPTSYCTLRPSRSHFGLRHATTRIPDRPPPRSAARPAARPAPVRPTQVLGALAGIGRKGSGGAERLWIKALVREIWAQGGGGLGEQQADVLTKGV